jgi:UDP-glucose 4-epimerase
MKDLNSILLLGSNGFIGMNLVSWFRERGVYVIGIDQAVTPDNTLKLQLPHKFAQLRLPDAQFAEILHRYQPNVVINAAGPASVSASINDPCNDFQESVGVNVFVLDAIRKNLPECKYLYLSSAAVYGNPINLPITENHSLMPVSPYGYHKMICETMIQEYCNIYGIKASILRIFSVYGPGLKKQILWDIYCKSLSNADVNLFGTGEETRDFIYVRDLARAVYMLTRQSLYNCSVFNVASGNSYPIKALSKKYLSALKMDNTNVIFSGEPKRGDPEKWCAEISKLLSFGYSPRYSLEQGLTEYAEWITANNHG